MGCRELLGKATVVGRAAHFFFRVLMFEAYLNDKRDLLVTRNSASGRRGVGKMAEKEEDYQSEL
jgi:hypothetical protein